MLITRACANSSGSPQIISKFIRFNKNNNKNYQIEEIYLLNTLKNKDFRVNFLILKNHEITAE